ncbi:unnamed protein product [Pieris macdunnoughi]|uniref:Uncharacterized protein n=1 Tax=Pieris macdunnoughi TaxID=345717 RepID=A0A821XZD6_9NEOP|nr:unnamed protein product [Pieris macdunnoughi]
MLVSNNSGKVETLNKKLQTLDLNARKNNIILHGIVEPTTKRYEELNASKKIQILRNKKMKENTYITNDYSKETMEKRKARRASNFRENEKRTPETPSPKETTNGTSKKKQRTDAFQLTRERAYSTSERNT